MMQNILCKCSQCHEDDEDDDEDNDELMSAFLL